jgi:hypothetical protein
LAGFDFYIILPQHWLFPANGDVVEGKRRAEEYLNLHGTYHSVEEAWARGRDELANGDLCDLPPDMSSSIVSSRCSPSIRSDRGRGGVQTVA